MKFLNIPVDLIYIDASHDYLSVYADLCAWYPYVKENGILCGDDMNIGNVYRAVLRFGQENQLLIYSNGTFWMYY